jgi:hypothetical protein
MSRYKHPLDTAREISEKGPGFRGNGAISHRTRLKYMWLASIPDEIKSIIRQFEDIFTTRVLLNVFASRQTHFEKENWKYLKAEVTRYLQNGKKHRPRKALNYPKNRAGGSLEQQRKRQAESKDPIQRVSEKKSESVGFMNELAAQERLRERCATWVEVGNGEIRIKFCSTEDLERIVEIIVGSGADLDRLLRGM